MLSLNECKKIINAKENRISDDQMKKIIELFYFWANIELNNYKKTTNEKRNNL